MTKNQLSRIYNQLDDAKFELQKKGYAFDFKLVDNFGDYMHCGIGTGEEMAKLALIELCDLFKARTDKSVGIEAFVDSVRDRLLMFAEKNGIS